MHPCRRQTPLGHVPLPSSFLRVVSPAPDPPPFLHRRHPSPVLLFPLQSKPPTATPGATLCHRLALASELAAVGSHGHLSHPRARAIRSFSGREPPLHGEHPLRAPLYSDHDSLIAPLPPLQLSSPIRTPTVHQRCLLRRTPSRRSTATVSLLCELRTHVSVSLLARA
jgi:hypothetical protein